MIAFKIRISCLTSRIDSRNLNSTYDQNDCYAVLFALLFMRRGLARGDGFPGTQQLLARHCWRNTRRPYRTIVSVSCGH